MNQIVENPSRIRRFTVVGCRALSVFDKRCSQGTKCATADDQGATSAQRGFHYSRRGATASAREGSGAAHGFSD